MTQALKLTSTVASDQVAWLVSMCWISSTSVPFPHSSLPWAAVHLQFNCCIHSVSVNFGISHTFTFTKVINSRSGAQWLRPAMNRTTSSLLGNLHLSVLFHFPPGKNCIQVLQVGKCFDLHPSAFILSVCKRNRHWNELKWWQQICDKTVWNNKEN